jgi:phospholipid/cholesterol/gamma-HCH transport system permease protein
MSDRVDKATATLDWPAADELRIVLRGRLVAASLPAVWDAARDPILQRKPRRVDVDASGVDYCDGAGLGLFLELRRSAATVGGDVRLIGLSDELARLVQASTLTDPLAPQLAPPSRTGLPQRVGRATAMFFRELAASVAFVGEMTAALAVTAVRPSRIRGRDFWRTCQKVGVDALPVVCLLGGLIGLIMAFQTATVAARYGATPFIPAAVSLSIVRELGPLIVAIIVAGRSGAAFAAEIGTMKVTEELDALRTLGLPPTTFLAVPRVLAAVAMVPLLTVFANVVGIAAGVIVMRRYGYSVSYYITAVQSAIDYGDLLGGLAKTLVFGLIVGAVGCMKGLRTQTGPSAVGESTTRAVVTSIVLIVVADMIFGVVYDAVGI